MQLHTNINVKYLRSTADHDATNTVSKSIGVHTGHIIIDNLHFTALELTDLIQADLVLLWVLSEMEMKWQKLEVKSIFDLFDTFIETLREAENRL